MVGFTAYSELSQTLQEDDLVRFDETLTNYGNFYSAASSIFLCPYNGLYLFSMHVLAAQDSSVQINIMVDGRQMVIAWADGIDGVYPQSSNTVVTECFEGQSVWLQSSSQSNGSRIFNNAFKHSTFSGVLIQKFN